MKTQDIIRQSETFSAKNYHPLPVVIERGEGVWVWDCEGKKYLDCLSAYSALNQGHRHPRIIRALKEQADRLTLCSRAFHNDQMGPFLAKLCQVTQMERALPMNTGTEAVESAIKLARKWGYQKKKVKPDSAEIIVCENNFHGRTTTVISFSSEPQYRDGFGPFTPGFKIIPYGDLDALKQAIGPNTVGFLVEPIQGEAGILVPPAGFLSAARQLCTDNRVLLMLDEIQTGLCRTGKFFCYQHEADAKPDLLILGKALGGGVYPVSAVLASQEVMDVLRPGDHGSTFGGNSMAAHVGLAALEVLIEERLADKAWELGQYFMDKIRAIQSPHVDEVRGKGLLVGVEIKKSSGPARPFCEKLAQLGVLAKETHGQVIRLAPPLVITRSELDSLLEKLAKVLS